MKLLTLASLVALNCLSMAYADISTPTVVESSTQYTFQYNYTGTPTYRQIFIDTDKSSTTGYSKKGIGAEFLLENGRLYRFNAASQSSWGWSYVKKISHTNKSLRAIWKLNKGALPKSFKIVASKNAPDEDSKVVSFGVTSTGGLESTPIGGMTGPSTNEIITIQPLSSSAIFNNPERGFHHFVGISTSEHAANLANGSTLAISVVNLGAFKNASLSASFLTQYQNMFTNARNAGVKLILLHKYHDTANFTSDPSESRIIGHINQLTPIMSAHSDVVYTIHGGFIGAWGEWYYTQHSASVRKNVIHALLNGLPPSLSVAIRTPAFKVNMFNMTGPNIAGIDAQLAKRVGHHNDCFLAGPDDMGTGGGYTLGNPPDWRDFIGQENRLLSVPVGGETCAMAGSISSCSNALTQLARQGYSYLNIDYHLDVLQGWRDGGCFDEINRRLGYRFKINQAQYPAEVSSSSTFNFSMLIENSGFAGMVNSRPVKLVLFTPQTEYVIDLNQNPKTWIPGLQSVNAVINLSQANITPGEYNLAIWMPDNHPGLQNRPGYSVQFANALSWDAVKGRNVLKNSTGVKAVLKVK